MSQLDDAITGLNSAVSTLGTDVATAVSTITSLQALVAAGTATPADMQQLAALQASVAQLDSSIQAVINTPTPAPAPAP